MKNQALHWLGFTYLVSRAERTTEPCAEPGNAEASRRKVQSIQDAEQGATSNQAIRKQGGKGQILNPFPLAQGYWKVTWSPEARKSPWGLLPFKARSRVPSFSSKTQPGNMLSPLLHNSLKGCSSKEGEPEAILLFTWGGPSPSFPPCRQDP